MRGERLQVRAQHEARARACVRSHERRAERAARCGVEVACPSRTRDRTASHRSSCRLNLRVYLCACLLVVERSCESIIFSRLWLAAGESTAGIAARAGAAIARYSHECCISRSRAATAVLTPDSSTTREQQQSSEGARVRCCIERGSHAHACAHKAGARGALSQMCGVRTLAYASAS